MDASFERLESITPHGNADSLEVATVSGFPCVVRKGEFKEGELCFYVRDDAKLISFDEWKADANAHLSFPWQEPLLKYLGSGGRVKTIRLRGALSMGILLKPEAVCGERSPKCGFKAVDKGNFEDVNSLIRDPDGGAKFLEREFGVVHWESPITGFGAMNVAYRGLPFGLWKTDSENWENLPEEDLHLGSKCVVTRKYDGSSTTVTCRPDGGYEVSCRSMTFRDETDQEKMNAYQRLTREIVRAGLWWAKRHGKIIAFRSESCCGAFNKSSYNKCCGLNDSFVFECDFPEEANFFDRIGAYGTDFHFLKVVEECNANGFDVKTVDVLEKDVTVTKELLRKYNDAPYTDGEGAVVGIKVEDRNAVPSSYTWQYKSKSRDYLSKMK